MAVFLFGHNLKPSSLITNIFYIGDFLCNFMFLIISIITIFIWGLKSDSKRIKYQSNILVLSSAVPVCLNFMTQTIIPLLGVKVFPSMGQLYSISFGIKECRNTFSVQLVKNDDDLLYKAKQNGRNRIEYSA